MSQKKHAETVSSDRCSDTRKRAVRLDREPVHLCARARRHAGRVGRERGELPSVPVRAAAVPAQRARRGIRQDPEARDRRAARVRLPR